MPFGHHIPALFLHFFDVHFLEAKTSGRIHSYIRAECEYAVRFALLSADEVLVPAASFFESALCQQVIQTFEPLYDTGLIRLVGGGSSAHEFCDSKLFQYPAGSTQHQCYTSKLSTHVPPFRSRANSSTADIIRDWSDTLSSGKAVNRLTGNSLVSVPTGIEKRWEDIPAKLGSSAFITEHVAPMLFGESVNLMLRNRLHAVINQSYFESFTKELSAGIVSDLVYLEAPHPILAHGPNLPYQALLRACRRAGNLEHIMNASPNYLFQFRDNPGWISVLHDTLTRTNSKDAGAQLRYFAVGGMGMAKKLKAFIVHGHDREGMMELKDYLQNTLGFAEPVVLEQQPSGGRTIIEKFERLAEGVDVVFVLMTGDDLGGTSDGQLTRRARQNVIFELGYFVGKLGRTSGRVVLLHRSAEVPSDLQGIVYIDISRGVTAAGESIRREVSALTQPA